MMSKTTEIQLSQPTGIPARAEPDTQTAGTAVAAQAKASIEARWTVAIHQPRSLDQVRTELLRECKRPSFAEVALYRKPVGRGIEGLSIRFVEAALQSMGNVDTQAVTIFDDATRRILEVQVTDYERNVTHRKQLTLTKTVERKSLRRGQVALSSRTNSYGETTHTVLASDDELLNKENALVSKALRTCGLRIIPGWLQDEATAAVRKTQSDAAATDPDTERRRLADAFATIGVQPSDLATYLGHELAKLSPAQIPELRAVYTAISEGQTTWIAALEHKAGAQPTAKGNDGLREALTPTPE